MIESGSPLDPIKVKALEAAARKDHQDVGTGANSLDALGLAGEAMDAVRETAANALGSVADRAVEGVAAVVDLVRPGLPEMILEPGTTYDLKGDQVPRREPPSNNPKKL